MAIHQLTSSQYTKIARQVGVILPIEQAPPWLEFDAKMEEREALGLFVYQPDTLSRPVALFAMTQYTQPRYKMVWIKHGPVWLQSPNTEEIALFVKELKRYVATHLQDVTFIRLNLPDKPGRLVRPSIHKVMYDQTVVIDLTKSEEERLADMTQGGRQALRKAEKVGGLKTKEVPYKTKEDFKPFYAILQETAVRGGFGIHPLHVYTTMLETLGPHVRLFGIYHNKELLAWAIVTLYEGRGLYYYGASSHQAREFNAPYQLHWDIMQTLKKEGAKAYDFMGIASPGHESLNNVSVFKKKFSRHITMVSPSYDIVLQPRRYKLLDLLRKTRQRLRF